MEMQIVASSRVPDSDPQLVSAKRMHLLNQYTDRAIRIMRNINAVSN